MQLLLEEGADINFRYHEAPVLFAAAMATCACRLDERNCPLVQSLLRQGADPNVVGFDETLLHGAIRFHKFSLAHILLEGGADIDQRGPTSSPLLDVAYRGRLNAAKFLLQRGADVESMEKPYTKPHSICIKPGLISLRDFVLMINESCLNENILAEESNY